MLDVCLVSWVDKDSGQIMLELVQKYHLDKFCEDYALEVDQVFFQDLRTAGGNWLYYSVFFEDGKVIEINTKKPYLVSFDSKGKMLANPGKNRVYIEKISEFKCEVAVWAESEILAKSSAQDEYAKANICYDWDTLKIGEIIYIR